MSSEDVEKTPSKTCCGQLECLLRPMGLFDAFATFQTLVNTVFQHGPDCFRVFKWNDFFVVNGTVEKQFQHLL